MTGVLLGAMVAAGMVVVVPLGLRLIDGVPALAYRIWPAVGALALCNILAWRRLTVTAPEARWTT